MAKPVFVAPSVAPTVVIGGAEDIEVAAATPAAKKGNAEVTPAKPVTAELASNLETPAPKTPAAKLAKATPPLSSRLRSTRKA